jgi:hypothetical protein
MKPERWEEIDQVLSAWLLAIGQTTYTRLIVGQKLNENFSYLSWSISL